MWTFKSRVNATELLLLKRSTNSWTNYNRIQETRQERCKTWHTRNASLVSMSNNVTLKTTHPNFYLRDTKTYRLWPSLLLPPDQGKTVYQRSVWGGLLSLGGVWWQPQPIRHFFHGQTSERSWLWDNQSRVSLISGWMQYLVVSYFRSCSLELGFKKRKVRERATVSCLCCFLCRCSVFAVKFDLWAFVVALCLKKPQPQRLFQRWRRSERPALSEECTLLGEYVCRNVWGNVTATSSAFSPDEG